MGHLLKTCKKAINPAFGEEDAHWELTMLKKTLLTKIQTYMMNKKKKRSHTEKMKLQCSLQVQMMLK